MCSEDRSSSGRRREITEKRLGRGTGAVDRYSQPLPIIDCPQAVVIRDHTASATTFFKSIGRSGHSLWAAAAGRHDELVEEAPCIAEVGPVAPLFEPAMDRH